VVVQLSGNDPEIVVKAGRKVEGLCDAIDLNLGCPQEHARDGHYGAYLLGQKDWSLIERIVSQLSNSLSIPISAKLRLCSPSTLTPELGKRIAANGASWITLHARHVNARKRRAGPADLEAVRALKDTLGEAEEGEGVRVVSNGNVGTWDHILRNREDTGADGIMVGESLLENPCLFENKTPDPVLISLEYLDLCKRYPGTVTIANIRTHVRHFIEYQCARRPWYPHFRAALNHSQTIDEIENLLRGKVLRWRGKAGMHTRRRVVQGEKEEGDEDDMEEEGRGEDRERDEDYGDLSLIE